MTNALFICGKARMRSPTAAEIAGVWNGIATDFAGLSNDADEKLSIEQVEWADIIFVMEPRQHKRLVALFATQLRGKRIVTLNIPDHFGFMDPKLISRLTPRLKTILCRSGL
jgi:predicted protein tyrosine phosphatase